MTTECRALNLTVHVLLVLGRMLLGVVNGGTVTETIPTRCTIGVLFLPLFPLFFTAPALVTK